MKKNTITITVEAQMKMERAISRNMEIESGNRVSHNRVHKTKKTTTVNNLNALTGINMKHYFINL